MSLLKKLKKKVQPVVVPTMSREVAEKNMQNAVFQLNNASFVLLERMAEAMDAMVATKKAMNSPMSDAEARNITYMDTLINHLSSLDRNARHVFIKNPGDVLDIDDLNHQFHRIIKQMEQMSLRSLDIFEKVADTMNSTDRYMWLESESDYLNSLLSAVKYGMDLSKAGRKRVTLNDIKKIVRPNEPIRGTKKEKEGSKK